MKGDNHRGGSKWKVEEKGVEPEVGEVCFMKESSQSAMFKASPGESKGRGPSEVLHLLPWGEPKRNRLEMSTAWKPLTLRWPILGGIIALSIAAIILLEILAKRSSSQTNGGGLVFADDVDSFPASVSFIYLYLPIIIAVLFSMLLSWIDLDAKRLEPWLQLSKVNGVIAENSVLLQYPFDILPLVPINAAKRRHWSVFCSGTAVLLAFWVVTPLQPAIFSTGTVSRSISVPMGNSASLASLTSQANGMTANFLNLAYGITWLNQSLPPYTTHEFATLPFQPVNKSDEGFLSETWTTITEVYRTNITCKPAIVRQDPGDPRYQLIDNGEGCIVQNLSFPDLHPNGTQKFESHYKANNLVMYIGWDSDARVDRSFGGPKCGKEFSNNYLAVHATSAGRISASNFSDMQSFFCKPVYEVEKMSVTVNASDGAIVEAQSLPERTIVTRNIDEVFNRTLFEYIIGAGVNPLTDTFFSNTFKRRTDYPDLMTVELYSRTANLDVAWPLTNMAGFALGLNTLPLQELADPEKLRRMFEKAHQLLFASAISVITRQNASAMAETARTGYYQDRPAAILLIRPICLAVEAVFGLIIILAAVLWLVSARRISKLKMDPASIADIMAMLPNRLVSTATIVDDGMMSTDALEKHLSGQKFSLTSRTDIQPAIDLISEARVYQPRSQSSRSIEQMTPTAAIRPWEHRSLSGAVFSGVIALALAALVYLQILERRNNGIKLPTENATIRSIIQNYAPTTVATFLEPIWVILSRLLCLLQPYEVLQKGNASAAKSLRLQYTALPPQLAIWRAIRAKHILLAVVCIITVSTNFLAVTLAGLLNEGVAIERMTYQASLQLLPQLNISQNFSVVAGDHRPLPSKDQFYIALSNASANTSMPPWLDKQHYYLPFTLPSANNASKTGPSSTFFATTYAISTEMECSPIFPIGVEPAANTTLNFSMNALMSEYRLTTHHILKDGSKRICGPNSIVASNRTVGIAKIDIPGTGAHALEMIYSMTPVGLNESSDYGFCRSRLVAGWGRLGPATQRQPRSLKFEFVSCAPRVQIAEFNISVTHNGKIISSKQTGPDLLSPSRTMVENSPGSGNMSWILTETLNEKIARDSFANFYWHNDSFTSDWINHIMIARSKHQFSSSANLTSLMDPLVPIPNGTALAASLGSLYSQLAATMISIDANAIFARAATPVPVRVEVHTPVTKLFVSDTMFKISLVLLIAHLCTAVAYYILRPKRFLTRMPTSIASVIAYVSCSRALDDFAPSKSSSRSSSPSGEKPEGRRGDEQRYGYGRFIGRDGKTHVGIERMRYVIPLESENPAARRRRWWEGGVRWRGRGRGIEEREVGTWI